MQEENGDSIPQTNGTSIDTQPFGCDNQPDAERPIISRHSKLFRNFKNPPQPHMCIKDFTVDGQELFINVMSWTRIGGPRDANSPVPLYGGMRVSVVYYLHVFNYNNNINFFIRFTQ